MIVGNSFPGMVVVCLGSGAESAEGGENAERFLELLESCLEDLFLFFGFD